MEKRFKFDIGGLIEKLGQITSSHTLSEQADAYMESVSLGHGVITVAHSQGNFFTNEAFKLITGEHKKSWMKPYLHMIGVAPPSTEVFNGGSHVLFDNDTIAVLQAQSVTHHNPHRSQFRNAVNEVVEDFDVAFHSFAYYMGENVTYEDGFGSHTVSTNIAKINIEEDIISALNAHLSAKSQWEKAKDIGCMCKQKRIIMKHKWDNKLTKEFASTKIYEFNEEGKLYHVLTPDLQGLTFARSSSRDGNIIEEVDRDDVCYVLKDDVSSEISSIEGLKQAPSTKPGVVEIALTWDKPELDYDLVVEWDAGEVDVKDTGCPMEHFHIKSEMKIYPGKFRVSIIPKNPSDEGWEDPDLYPFTIDMETKTPGTPPDSMHFKVKNQSDINLGHVSDIKVIRVNSNSNGDGNQTDPDSNSSSGGGGILIVPQKAPECPPVQHTPSPVPPKPIYFPRGGSGGWSWGIGGGTFGFGGGGGGGGGGGSYNPPFTPQHAPGCGGDIDCLPIPTDNNNSTNIPPTNTGPSLPFAPEVGGRPLPDGSLTDSNSNKEGSSDGNCTGSSCGCIPCEYKIIPYLRQIYFGPLRDANFSIYSLDGYVNKESLFDGKTSNGKTLYDAGEIDVPKVFLDTLEDDKLYIIEAHGGEDIDRNDDFIVDSAPVKNKGKVYAIASGKDIKYTGFKINILTTVTFELLKQSIYRGRYTRRDRGQNQQNCLTSTKV